MLQVTETSVLQMLASQGPCLAVLGLITTVLWKRLKDLEDKLTKYMDEDRKVMMEVISKNTAAFDKVTDHLDSH